MSEAIALVCKTCGRDFVMPEGKMLWPCPGCSTAHSRPRAEKWALADLRHAHQQRSDCDFVNAAANYQRVLNAHPDEAEALWGLALCKYGVEFVQDEKTGEHLPVIHFLNRRPFTEDPDCRLAMEKAGEADLPGYQKTAAYIARIQQEVLAAESQGREYDVFLCYKGSVPGAPHAVTREYKHALLLYTALREEGYSVFFAHMTLRRAAGANYEAQIFQALQSARVMLVVVSEPAYLNTPWVQSEWRRYLERVDAKDDCRLVPLLYDHCDPYNLPDAFQRRSIQGLAMDNVTALDDLRSILAECVPDDQPEPVRETVVVQQPAAPGIESLLRRATLFLEDGNWASADEYCEKVLDIDPECARAYVGKLMAAMKVRQQGMLKDAERPFDSDPNYRKALRFADAALKKELQDANAHIRERSENAAKEAAYRKAEQALASAKTEQDFLDAKKEFEVLGGWKDAAKQTELCTDKAEEAHKNNIYEKARRSMTIKPTEATLSEAIRMFQTIPGWKDADQQIEACQRMIEELKAKAAAEAEERQRREEAAREARRKAVQQRNRRVGIGTAVLAAVVAVVLLVTQVIIPNGKYNAAVALMESGDYEAAIAVFEALGGYKDSQARIDSCNTAIMDGKYDAAVALMNAGQYDEAIAAFEALGGYRDSQAQIVYCENAIQLVILDGKYNAAVALMENGDYPAAITAFAALNGYKDSDTQISECRYRQAENHLTNGETALAAMSFYQLGDYKDAADRSMALWAEITERNPIAAGDEHTVGLRADGSVVAVGSNSFGQCNVTGWSDVVAIAAGNYHTVGLRADGSVVAVGYNNYGQCDVTGWSDVVAIAAGHYHTVGLRADGSVVVVGYNTSGQCRVTGWSDVIAIAAGGLHNVGLRADGSVVAVGYNTSGQCDVTGWSDIVAIAAGDWHTVGLRADGSVVAVGSNHNGQCNVTDWQLKQIPRPTLPE